MRHKRHNADISAERLSWSFAFISHHPRLSHRIGRIDWIGWPASARNIFDYVTARCGIKLVSKFQDEPASFRNNDEYSAVPFLLPPYRSRSFLPVVSRGWSRVRSIPLLVKYDYNVADHPRISVFRPDAAKSVATRSPWLYMPLCPTQAHKEHRCLQVYLDRIVNQTRAQRASGGGGHKIQIASLRHHEQSLNLDEKERTSRLWSR